MKVEGWVEKEGEDDENKGEKKEMTLATSCEDRQSFYDREDKSKES